MGFHENSNLVQSCITTIGFPSAIDDLFYMLDKNEGMGEQISDLEVLLRFDPDFGVEWTSPKWITEGDILFFYHTKNAPQHITHLYNQIVKTSGTVSSVVTFLENALNLAKFYSGTIFGCAQISGSAIEALEGENGHFKGRIFAPLGKVHIFNQPLSAKRFSEFVKIGQNTITPLYNREFEGIRQLLAEENRLPEFLREARFGTLSFRDVNQENWSSISCSPTTRFIDEAQIRAYLLDYLLNEIKDKGTPLLEECQCFRNIEQTGIADYFVSIKGHWIPVEAKLNILAERDILSQIGKYIHIDSFVPTKGAHRGRKFDTRKSSICLIADQTGVFITQNKEFYKCDADTPVWRREELNISISAAIRSGIMAHCL